MASTMPEELKLKEVDPDAKKMKAHVLQMIKKYTMAKKLELSTGFGDLKDMTKVKGKIVLFTKIAIDQLLEICRVFKILDTKLGERHANSISAIMGIIRKGLRGAEMLLDGEGEISSGSNTPVSSATQSRLEERSKDTQSCLKERSKHTQSCLDKRNVDRNSYGIVEVDDAIDNSADKSKDLDSSPDLEIKVTPQKKAQSKTTKVNIPMSLERASFATKVSGVKKGTGRHILQESQVGELTSRAPRKLGVLLVVQKGSKGRLDLKAAGKRIHTKSDSDEKEEPDDDEAGHQRMGTKKKKSAQRIEIAKLKWNAKMLEHSPIEREKNRALKQQELEIQKAWMMMEKAQFVLTHGMTPEDFFEKLKSGNFIPTPKVNACNEWY
ncbi:hypothetical protein BGX38DRAFT_1278535 [Terfezia claveryi]|nr:hypothetical protein BGX38DRAFT_1278535 [Terfezia claveryi]